VSPGSGIMLSVDEQTEPDEPSPAATGDPEGPDASAEETPAQAKGFRLSAAFQGPGKFNQQPIASIFQTVMPQIDRWVAVEFAPVTEAMSRHVESLVTGQAAQFDALRDAVSSLRIKPVKLDIPTDWLPANWDANVDFDAIDAIYTIVRDEGIPMVWVPRPAIVGGLIHAADAQARGEILVASRVEIAEDCAAAISEVTAPQLQPLVTLASAAVAALKDGHSSAAQALAANVFDTLLRDAARRGVLFPDIAVGYFRYDKILKRIVPVSGETTVRQFRTACVLSAALPALQNFTPGEAAPARFVRHATAHSVGLEQYTEENAIVAVMLMTSMLREGQASGW
jgi:hypothetical protein